MTADAVDPPLPELFTDAAPSVEALLADARRARVAGCVIGAAVGDAMGHETEFLRSFEAIRARFGPDGVTGYERWGDDRGRRVALYTDDTQMAEVVLRSLLVMRRDGLDLDGTMRVMGDGFVRWADEPQGGHRAPGNACLSGCRALAAGTPWDRAGGERAGGCGSVMRAYPFGLVFVDDLATAEAWAVAHSKLTHRDPIALAASAAMAVGVARSLHAPGDGGPHVGATGGATPADAEPFDATAAAMIDAARRHDDATADRMQRALDEARDGTDPEVTLARLEGWAAHEAIAAAVYVTARHPDDPRAAILEAANTPGDSDSLATLAGALTGARRGLGALPRDWVDDLERVDVLLALAAAV